jgi:zinc/manganese transport system substrate-binding protein
VKRPVVALLAVVALGLAACGTQHASAAGVVPVVATENFWGDIAAQIGGPHARVRSLISDPAADPHLYDSNAGGAAAVADASVVIENGLGYDDFVNDLLSATSGHKHVVNASTVMGISGDDANPHVWYALENVPKVAQAIADALTAADPGDRAFFAARVDTFNTSLRPALDALHEIRATYASAPVAYTERVPGYLVQEAGLSDRTPPGFARAIEDGNEPNARDTEAMNDLVRSRGVKVLLYNTQATSPVTKAVRDLAREEGVSVVGVTETMPEHAASYQAWMLDQIRALRAALSR